MATPDEALTAALRHHQAGQLAQAESIYRQIIAQQPGHARALHLVGAVCLQQNRPREAAAFLEQAVAAAPGDPECLNHLGGAYQALQKWVDSVRVLRNALSLSPENPKFHFDLGNSLKALDQFDEAIDCFETAIRLQPGFLQAIHNLGTTLTAADRPEEAIRIFELALAKKPDYANAQNGLGNALLELGRADEAVGWLSKAVTLRPGEAKFHCNLGVALKAMGELDAAIRCYQTAVKLNPQMPEAHKNLGNLLISQQHPADAVRAFKAAAKLSPEDEQIMTAIGDGCRDLEDFAEARSCYQAAVNLRPGDSWLRLREAFLCPSIPDSVEAIHEYRSSLLEQLQGFDMAPLLPAEVESRAVMPPFGLPYHGLNDRPLKQAIANLYQASFPVAEAARDISSPTRPKIGFVVTNGHEGIFIRCMGGLIDRLDRNRFDVLVIAPQAASRFIRSRLQHDQTGYVELPDRFERMAETIRRANPDLLYYWECGTDLYNYCLPMQRIAPVQCTGWGLPVTTGLAAMDFYLTSRLAEPSHAVDHYSESLISADTLLTWQEPVERPAKLKSREDFGFTNRQKLYLCAQNLMKIHPDFDKVIAQILRRDPAGHLVLVEDRTSRWKQQLQSRFARRIPDVADRIEFRPRMAFADYLSLVSAADVALDPLHYGSGITAHEIFCCGTPLVTLPAEFRRGRFVAACYTKMDMHQCTAVDSDDYVRIACEVAGHPELRAQLAAEIDDRRHLLFQDKSAVTAFENAVETMLSSERSDRMA